MEPVEHFLFGAALSRAGFNRTTGYATLAMVLAAEAPDLDVLYSLRGPIEGFQHHRGWMHSFVGTPIVALATVAVVWGVSKLWRRNAKLAEQVPVRWGRLFLLAWLAALSHLALDWTNNYGLRPFWPFSPKWYEGDLVFIVEPVMLGVLCLAVLVPWLLGLADREIGVRKVAFRGQYWAWFALTCIAALWTVRAVEHARAIHLAEQREWEAGDVRRIGLSPFPLTPFAWHAIIDTGDKYQTAHIDSWNDAVHTDPQADIVYKQAVTPAIATAEGSKLGRAYMDWSSYPLVTAEDPQVDEDESNARSGTLTPVEFNDLRFDYDILGTSLGRGASKRALGGEVLLGPDGSVVQMKMGNRVER
jgi:inner membrane protein